MAYTILSAAYANAERTAAVVQTQEAGAVVVSAKDTPALWAAMVSAAPPGAYAAPAKPVPASITRFQARAALLQSGLLAQAETAGAAASAVLKMAWADAPEFRRSSPTIAALAKALNLTSAQLDALFITASGIEA
jgi:hypothetical protein